MQYIIPIIIFGVAVGVFFGFVDPIYKDIQQVQKQSAQLNDALNDTKTIQDIRDSLLERFNTIDPADIARIEKLLPDNVDNVRLILEIDDIASRYGMLIQDVGISEQAVDENVIGPQKDSRGSLDMTFTTTGTYSSFRNFIVALEKSLRIVDIRDVSFSVSDDGFDAYKIILRTYWLR